MDNIFNLKSIVMGIGTMTEDDLDLSDSSHKIMLLHLTMNTSSREP